LKTGDYYSGKVKKIIFRNPSNGYYVLRIALDKDPLDLDIVLDVTVSGNVYGMDLETDTWFPFEAVWNHHPKYGKQLKIVRAPSLARGWEPDLAQNVLTTNGVGWRVLHQIRTVVGDESFVATLDNVEALKAIPGVTEFAAMHVVERWRVVRARFRAQGFMEDVGIAPYRVAKVWTHFGDDAEEILSENPWRLVEIDGITFDQADEVAKRLGLSLGSTERVRGAVIYRSKVQKSHGHLFARLGSLCTEVRSLVHTATNEDVAEALTLCHEERQVIVDREAVEGLTAVYEPWARVLEVDSSRFLAARMKAAVLDPSPRSPYIKKLGLYGPETARVADKGGNLREVAHAAVHEWETHAKLTLSPKQKEGVINALTEPVSIITGLPGTGKTVSAKAIARILREAEIPFLMVAPTGIAAKNLTHVTGVQGFTIHRAFGAKGDSQTVRETTYAGIVGESGTELDERGGLDDSWGFGPNDAHKAEVLLVDEVSMVDQHLIYRILSCTDKRCRLILVGDAAQLPSVGPGNVLRDLIAFGKIPTVSLTDIFRQAEQSDIVIAAHAIHRGSIPETARDSDFSLLEIPDEDTVLLTILRLAEKLYSSRRNFQVLSPRHHGTVGVTNLNRRLRELLNPKQPGLREIQLFSGAEPIREGDRVMVVKNNYQRGVFNGDMGKIAKIDKDSSIVVVKIHGDLPLFVKFPFTEVPVFLRMSYACTIHKYQGLETDVIVMPLVESFRHQLQRNLLYTAITRAKQKVVLVGTESALIQAVDNDKVDARNTLFVERLLKG
jgi:exodeoxyribonuclease V alpha subunit